MPQQDYNNYTRDAVVGQMYGISVTSATPFSAVNVGNDPIGFGLAVQDVAGLGNDRQCQLGGGGNARISGISIRQLNKMMQTVPGTGAIAYQVGEVVGVLKEGFIHVRLAAGSANAVKGNRVWVNDTTGQMRADTAAGFTQSDNITFESTGVAGDIVVAKITLASQA